MRVEIKRLTIRVEGVGEAHINRQMEKLNAYLSALDMTLLEEETESINVEKGEPE